MSGRSFGIKTGGHQQRPDEDEMGLRPSWPQVQASTSDGLTEGGRAARGPCNRTHLSGKQHVKGEWEYSRKHSSSTKHRRQVSQCKTRELASL